MSTRTLVPGDVVEVLLAGEPGYHARLVVLRPGHVRPYVVRLLHGVGHNADRPVTECPQWSAMALTPYQVGAVVATVAAGATGCPCTRPGGGGATSERWGRMPCAAAVARLQDLLDDITCSAAQYAGENAGEEQALRGLARRLHLVVATYYDEEATLTIDLDEEEALRWWQEIEAQDDAARRRWADEA